MPQNRSKCLRRQCRQGRFPPTRGYCDAYERRVEIDAIAHRLELAVEQAFERHGTAKLSDLLVDAVGAQQVADPSMKEVLFYTQIAENYYDNYLLGKMRKG